MNVRIAALLKDRISQFTYVDRLAGMVRNVKYERAGTTISIPVALDVDAAYACTDETLADMVPDERYGCMVYFEDRGTQRAQSRTRGISFISRVRLVCWVNTQKFAGDNNAAEKICGQFIGAIESGFYNNGPYIGLRHTIEGMAQTGTGIFQGYSYPEATRQYLMPPFDAFALDIATEYRVKPECQDEVLAEDEACWTPPITKKRRNPSEFSCDELNDPATGLTQSQLDCIDGCGGEGGCLFDIVVNVNGNYVTTLYNLDPCEDNTLNVNILD
jgi:hypothetical protein